MIGFSAFGYVLYRNPNWNDDVPNRYNSDNVFNSNYVVLLATINFSLDSSLEFFVG